MNRQGKSFIINYLVEQFKCHDCFYVIDATHLPVSVIDKFRRDCHDQKATYKVVKNTLVLKALEQLPVMNDVYHSLKSDVLKQVTGIVFINEKAQEPSKIILKSRQQIGAPRPVLKGAYVDGQLFIGDDKLEVLNKLKSKQELLGEIIGVLQTPLNKVLLGLRSSHHQLMGIIRTLGDKQG